MTPNSKIVGLGAVLAGLAVALGAFGAHGLKSNFVEGGEAWWQTGTQYMTIHALGIIFAGFWNRSRAVPWCFVIGIILFSGSLCLMSLTGVRILGAITPLGGLAFMIGWGSFAWSALKNPHGPDPFEPPKKDWRQ